MRLYRTFDSRPLRRRAGYLFILPLLLVAAGVLGQGTDVFEYEIPSGWTLRDAYLSENGWKALLIWQDVEPTAAYRGEFSSKLLVFDEHDRLIKELPFDKPKFFGLTREDTIILFEGEEEITTRITVISRNGQQLFEKPTNGKSPIPALLGKEIALGQWDGMGLADLVGPITVIDARAGRDKATLEPPVAGMAGALKDILPIGADGPYLAASGTSVALATYRPQEHILWRIQDVGGKVAAIEPLDGRHVGISYHVVEPDAQNPSNLRFLGGVIILEWRSGKIVFRQESRDPQKGPWSFLHDYGVNVSLMDGDLFFTYLSAGGGGGIRVPRSHGPGMKWDGTKIRSYRMTNARGDDNLTFSQCTMKRRQGLVRVERIIFAEEK